jgi:hypothetical protein
MFAISALKITLRIGYNVKLTPIQSIVDAISNPRASLNLTPPLIIPNKQLKTITTAINIIGKIEIGYRGQKVY